MLQHFSTILLKLVGNSKNFDKNFPMKFPQPFIKIYVCFNSCRGSIEATKQAHTLIAALIDDPEVDITQILPKYAKPVTSSSSWDKSSTVS